MPVCYIQCSIILSVNSKWEGKALIKRQANGLTYCKYKTLRRFKLRHAC